MNKKQMLMNEIRAVLQPKDQYFIRHTANGLFYRPEDYDLSICQPLPGAVGKAIERKGDIFNLRGCQVFF